MTTSDPSKEPTVGIDPIPIQEVPPTEKDIHTRNRLIRAGVNVFDRKGYSAASVREIVELAGVSKPALYYHFGSKEQLLREILREAVREFGMAIREATDRPGSTRDRLHVYAEAFLAAFSANVPTIRVAHACFVGPAEAGPTFDFAAFERQATEVIGRLIEEGMSAGEIRAAVPGDVTLAISGVVEAMAARQLHPGIEPTGPDVLRRVLDLVFDGVMTERRAQGAQTS